MPTAVDDRRNWGFGPAARVAVIAAMLTVALLLALDSAGRASAAVGTASMPRGVVIAVWGQIEADRPVAGATVRVYAGAPAQTPDGRVLGGHALVLTGGGRTGRTSPSGIALMAFRRLPRRFTVVVSGGRVHGRPMPGALRAVTARETDGGVVYVNPVTSLIAVQRTASAGSGIRLPAAAARQRDDRLFGIPAWVDDSDLSDSDRYFEADRWLAAARQVGGIAGLDDVLAREAARGVRDLRLIRRPRRQGAAVQRQSRAPALSTQFNWLSLLGKNPAALIKAVFTALNSGDNKKLGSVLAEPVGGALLGWLLPAAEKEQGNAQALAGIQQALETLNGQVTQLKGQVALDGFSSLTQPTIVTLGRIDRASDDMVALSKITTDKERAAKFAVETNDFIKANLTDAPQLLDHVLEPKVPLADNPIKSASRLVAGRVQFFGPADSARVKSVYDYYALYQTRLAVILTNYYHARADSFPVGRAEEAHSQLEQNIDSQAKALRPLVPVNTTIETATREMWTTDFPKTPGAPKADVNLRTIAEIGTKGGSHYVLRKPAGPTTLVGFPSDGWLIPTFERFQRLIAGRNGSNPLDWLVTQGFNRQFLEGFQGREWIRNKPKVTSILILNTMDVEQFSLMYGGSYRDGTIAWVGLAWMGEFDRFYADLIYYRPLGADEHYWW
jgi:hypothetical protein